MHQHKQKTQNFKHLAHGHFKKNENSNYNNFN